MRLDDQAQRSNSVNSLLTLAELATALRCSKAHACKVLNGQVPGLPALPHLTLGRRKLIRHAGFRQD